MEGTEQKKVILLRIKPEHWAMFKEEAQKRGMPLTVWMLQAALAYDATAERYARKQIEGKVWAKCRHCGKKHDPKTHGGEDWA